MHGAARRTPRPAPGLAPAGHAEAWLQARGVRYLQVKTVAATSASTAYAETRAFYLRRGFTPLEVFPTLWDAHNPALQCIKVLGDGERSAD